MQIGFSFNTINIMTRISEEEKSVLISRLNEKGFEFMPMKGKYKYRAFNREFTRFKDLAIGHIYPQERKISQEGYPLAVGFIGKDYADLVNLDVKELEKDHQRLEEVYNSI